MKRRTLIYVDGFNLYYGLLKNTKFRWLNLQRLFSLLRNEDEIIGINYFTARVEDDPQSYARQEAYLRALATTPLVRIIEGKFKYKTVTCPDASCQRRRFKVPEEKRTDVSIAATIVADAYEDACDTFVLVSGDSDLVPALDLVRMRFPKKTVIVYLPAQQGSIRGAATEIRNAATKNRTLPFDLIKRAQFPSEMIDTSGNHLRKPPGW